MDKLIEYLISLLRKRLCFYDGLTALLILSVVVYYWFVQLIGCRLLQVSKTCGLPRADELAPVFYLIGLGGSLFLLFIFWRKGRSIPKFATDELGILFAPDFEEEAEKEVDRLFIHLTQEIKSHELGLRFSLKRLPPNISITAASDAINILRNAGGVVAIWGTMEQQPSDQGRITGFSQISITFIHRPIHLHESRLESLVMSLVGRKLLISERTQMADRKIMARDIGLVVRNVLGVALMIDFKFQDAVKILGLLYASLQSLFPGKGSTPLQRFYLQVQLDLAHSLTMATGKLYNEFLFEDKLYEIPLIILETWLKNVEQAISLDPQNSVHYISKAIYLFLIGDIEGAIRADKKADKLAPRASSAQNFSLAFLYNFQGDFRFSRNQYNIGLAKKTSYDERMITQCIIFITQTIKRFPDKKQLKLALAVLELKRGSKQKGIIALEELLTDPPIVPELQGFVSEAKKLIEIAKSTKGNDIEKNK